MNRLYFSLNSSCNVGCKCSEYEYNPVCGTDGVNYYSPCHAGCINRVDSDGDGDETLPMLTNFTDCSCIDPEFGSQGRPLILTHFPGHRPTNNKVENPHNGPSAFLVIQLCGSREIEYVVNGKWNYTKLKVE